MVQRKQAGHRTVLQIFAREPVAGQVNTRLIPDIGAEQAAALQDELIQQRLNTFSGSGSYHVQLWCTPDAQAVYFQRCRQHHAVQLYDQAGEDLGRRMANAIRQGLNQYNQVILIGTDAPALDQRYVDTTVQVLAQGSDIVVVPAEDGGYVLIAMSGYYPEVFNDIEWGSSEVCAQTVLQIKKLKLKYALLEACWDIDRIEDYHRYREFLANS